MSRPLIRLSRQSYATLKAMSKETKKPMSKIAEDDIAHYEDERFWGCGRRIARIVDA